MAKVIFLILFVVLFSQTRAAISPRDLVDEAKKQLEELSSIVQGNIMVARNRLSTLEIAFLTYTNNILTTAVVSIEEEEQSIQQQLTTIKDLAHSANADITSCTDVREELLNRLPAEYTNLLKECIFAKNREEASLISQANYIVDVAINKVHRLEFQFNQCRHNVHCISPLLQEVELDKIRLPQNINTEVQSVETLLATLKLSVESCSDTNISGYTADASTILNDITSCVDKIIG